MTNQTETTKPEASTGAGGQVERVVMWLPGWYASKLHALPADKTPVGREEVRSICGQFVFGKAITDWAQRRIDKGVPHCKQCEKILTHNTVLTGAGNENK